MRNVEELVKWRQRNGLICWLCSIINLKPIQVIFNSISLQRYGCGKSLCRSGHVQTLPLWGNRGTDVLKLQFIDVTKYVFSKCCKCTTLFFNHYNLIVMNLSLLSHAFLFRNASSIIDPFLFSIITWYRQGPPCNRLACVFVYRYIFFFSSVVHILRQWTSQIVSLQKRVTGRTGGSHF